MTKSQQRRVNANLSHDLFWVTDERGNYGFSIESSQLSQYQAENIKLKGFDIFLENFEHVTRLYLVLNDNTEWQIFYWLCIDLINATESIPKNVNNKEKQLIPVVKTRLTRWQEILQKGRLKQLSKEQQMGLFSELDCLYHFALEKGVSKAITAWVGCESDKQDFLFDVLAVEVKSKRTSSGNKIHISSIEQLNCEKIPLYLLVYNLTNADTGETIKDVIKKIRNLSSSADMAINVLFDKKLFDYGYVHEIEKDNLLNFIVDKKQPYYVCDNFPKILPQHLAPQIQDVKYSIDLSQCVDYETSVQSLYNVGKII